MGMGGENKKNGYRIGIAKMGMSIGMGMGIGPTHSIPILSILAPYLPLIKPVPIYLKF